MNAHGQGERHARPSRRLRRPAGAAVVLALVVIGAPLPHATAQVAVTPPARSYSATAYEAAAQKVVLFGGLAGGYALGQELLDDTWTWDGSGWSEAPSGLRPPARRAATMAYDGAGGAIVLFGGDGYLPEGPCCLRLGDTWTWNGATQMWAQQLPAISPPARARAAMAYDAASGTVVLFGGLGPPTDTTGGSAVVLGDTWTWNGATRTWTKQAPAVSPPPRAGAAMAYDGATGTVVLFGGTGGPGGPELGDTWTWNGVTRTWTRETPSMSPWPRQGAAMTYHQRSQRVVLFGGAAANTELADTWTWNGATRTWSRRVPSVSPSPRQGPALADHPPTRRAVLFGGQDANSRSLADTWSWDGGSWTRRA